MRVCWMSKNAGESDLAALPLFGRGDFLITWEDFRSEIREYAVTNVESWCTVCSATEDLCPSSEAGSKDESEDESGRSNGYMSNAVAGDSRSRWRCGIPCSAAERASSLDEHGGHHGV